MANLRRRQTRTETSTPPASPSSRFSSYLPLSKGSKRISFFRASVLVTPVQTSGSSVQYRISTNMTKKQPRAPALRLGHSNFDGNGPQSASLSPNSSSPATPKTALSAPASPYFKGSTIRPLTAQSLQASRESLAGPKSPVNNDAAPPPTPGITAIPPYPASPREPTRSAQESLSKSFFTSLKGGKSSHRAQPSDGSSGKSSDHKPVSRGSSKDRSNRGRNQSSPDLPTTSEGIPAHEKGGDPSQFTTSSGKQSEDPAQSHKLATKKSKPRFANILTRTRSTRADDTYGNRPNTARRPSNGLLKLEEDAKREVQHALKTAPLQNERAFRDAMGSTVRNRSADRPPDHGGSDDSLGYPRKERGHQNSMLSSTSLSQVTSSALFTNIKQTSSGAADRLGRAGKGFLGKFTRTGTSTERVEIVTDDNYVCSVINLPLVEQTRRTRISKRLEASKDKTEFWMPALPWRCIDYLNFKGCEEEGLYRVPGSGRDVKHWQRRFDTELDINLFDEPDLYDINTIGSMFKAWLRELPDEIFPKQTQVMIAEKCPDAKTAPQLLKDELSKLPPFNYYLLFAITCHLSLLHSYVEKNKMDYRNLCICFQPCMKIDAYCFNFLVCDWKNCWQGCWTEKEYLEKELEAERQAAEQAKKQQQEQQSQSQPQPHQRHQNKASTKPSDSRTKSQERTVPGSRGTDKGSEGDRKGADNDGRPSSRPGTPKKGRKTPPNNIDTGHSRSVSQLPELGPPLSPIKI